MFTIIFMVFAATTLWLVGSTIFAWLIASPSPSAAVACEDEQVDDDDEPGEPILPGEPGPSSDGDTPRDEFLIDWDEFDAVRAAHEDRVPALTM